MPALFSEKFFESVGGPNPPQLPTKVFDAAAEICNVTYGLSIDWVVDGAGHCLSLKFVGDPVVSIWNVNNPTQAQLTHIAQLQASYALDVMPQEKTLPLLMRVYEDCLITLVLTGDAEWSFIDKPLMLGRSTDPAAATPAKDRYQTVKQAPPVMGAKTLTFYAPRYGVIGPHNRDGVNFAISVSQMPLNGTQLDALVLILDPDIKNPGDDTH